MKTKETKLWEGKFGNEYRERNKLTEEDINARLSMWQYVFTNTGQQSSHTEVVESIMEVGSGQGINLIAIKRMMQHLDKKPELFALEPNKETREVASENYKKENTTVYNIMGNANLIETPDYSKDVVFTSGVLIHIHPDNLLGAMKEIYRISKKFIICAEYFSPEPREVIYHGKQALWTNDFGSIWLDNFPLRCLGVTFFWKRLSQLDNLTVWVFEKVN